MEAFGYDKYVTGKYFVGRDQDCRALANLLAGVENVALYDAPKTGKTSLIRQTLTSLQTSGTRILTPRMNVIRVRSVKAFLESYLSSLLSVLGESPDVYESYLTRYLPDSCFGFDAEAYENFGRIALCRSEPSREDIVACLSLPDRIAKTLEQRICFILNEFSAIENIEGGDRLLDIMQAVEKARVKQPGCGACYIFSGSFMNAMKSIFEVRKLFHRSVEILPLSPIEEREVTEHIVRGFLSVGKSIERPLIHAPFTLLRGNMWYLNHLASICGSKAIGYINSAILDEALSTIVSLHRPKFFRLVNDLTDYQLRFVRAVLDGVVKFSASDVIEQYGFNSSANVKRLKDALMKKEIVGFNGKEEPFIVDPLFEYWLRNYYWA